MNSIYYIILMLLTKFTYLYVSNLQWSEASVVGHTRTNVPPQLSKINTGLVSRNEQDQCVVVLRSRAGGDVKCIVGGLVCGELVEVHLVSGEVGES